MRFTSWLQNPGVSRGTGAAFSAVSTAWSANLPGLSSGLIDGRMCHMLFQVPDLSIEGWQINWFGNVLDKILTQTGVMPCHTSEVLLKCEKLGLRPEPSGNKLNQFQLGTLNHQTSVIMNDY